MTQRLDEATHRILKSYLSDVSRLPNESAKTHRFAALIGELFPGTRASTQLCAGVEKVVRINAKTGVRRGRIDSYYGNAVIEFERSLRATADHAEEQLRDYVAGVWAAEGTDRPLVAITSDGVTWRTYRPRLMGRAVRPDNVELQHLRTLTVTDATLPDFWIWLTSLLFRSQAVFPSVEQFRVDFGVASLAFQDGMEVLRRAWTAAGARSEPRLAFNTWKKYLAVTYGSVSATLDLEALFLKHTYLACVARLLLWASFTRGATRATLRDVARDVLSGEFFRAHQLANLVEDDFFQWVRRRDADDVLASVWERMLVQILTYDLPRLGEDIFKGVYQELVLPAERHDLGEYYTPDWLCESITTDILREKDWPAVLDPACGSGSFLRAVITHLRRTHRDAEPADLLEALLQHVVGIDIHPLAVTIARATYLLALGPLVLATRRPIQIPVYLADSLFLPAEVRQATLGDIPGFEVRFGDKRVTIPESLVAAPEVFDRAVAGATRVAADYANGKQESRDSLEAYLVRDSPAIRRLEHYDHIINALWRFTTELAQLIRSKANSIWAFVVRNGYRPAMLKGRFDVIVGNPPWLSYRYIEDPEYQNEVKQRALVDYKIAPSSQKLFTQMELATVFFAHAISVFGREGAEIAFVMPRSILSGDQHVNLRARLYSAPFRLTRYWDLKDVRPLFSVPAAVLFAARDTSIGTMKDVLPVTEWSGQLPERDLPWSTAADHLRARDAFARVIFLGKNRTALSTWGGRTDPHEGSPYAQRFRQGATVIPRSFYFVAVRDLEELPPDRERLYSIETDPAQVDEGKPPWNEVKLKGQVDGQFLFFVAVSRHVLPFALLRPSIAVLPVERGVNAVYLRTAAELRKEGHREVASWMDKADALWRKHRGAKAKKQTIYDWLNYQNKLTAQNFGQRHLVLYNAAGTHVAAAYVDRNDVDMRLIVEHKLYWAAVDSQAEGDYLAAFLNSTVVNEAIKPFQSMGLLGERDIEKKVLEVAIPRYRAADERHRALAELGGVARRRASELVLSNELPKGLGQRRTWIREQLKATVFEIDAVAKQLL